MSINRQNTFDHLVSKGEDHHRSLCDSELLYNTESKQEMLLNIATSINLILASTGRPIHFLSAAP